MSRLEVVMAVAPAILLAAFVSWAAATFMAVAHAPDRAPGAGPEPAA